MLKAHQKVLTHLHWQPQSSQIHKNCLSPSTVLIHMVNSVRCLGGLFHSFIRWMFRWMFIFISCSLYILMLRNGFLFVSVHWKFRWKGILTLICFAQAITRLRGTIFLNCELPKTISIVFESTESFCGTIFTFSFFFCFVFTFLPISPFFHTIQSVFAPHRHLLAHRNIFDIIEFHQKLQIDSSLATDLLHN